MSSALLVVAHGTRDATGQDESTQLIELVRTRRPGLRVELGYLELCPPPITDTVESLVADGVTEITVVPLVLLAAGHAKGDVPAAIARERLKHPGVRFRYARALGVHPDLLERTDDRLRAVVPQRLRSETTAVIVGRGSSDPDANGDLVKITRLLWEGRPWSAVEPAFVSLTEPSVPQALERAYRLGARHLAVMPYFLFTGVLERRIRQQADQWGEGRGDVHLYHAGYLGPDPSVADLILSRYDEADIEGVAVNCDMCQYRVALPGFESKVGQPQTMHHHPDDAHTHVHSHSGTHVHVPPGGP